MYELFYNTLEFLVAKTEPIQQIYIKYIPKLLRFILYPLTQCVLGVTVSIAVVIAAIYRLLQLIRKAYDKYE